MRLLFAMAAVAAVTAGCTTVPDHLKDIDLSGRDKECTRLCLDVYYACAGYGGVSSVPAFVTEGCKSSFRRCVDACPQM